MHSTLTGSAVAMAIADGRKAARAGWGSETCPHVPGTEAARWWQEAFNSVRGLAEPTEPAEATQAVRIHGRGH